MTNNQFPIVLIILDGWGLAPAWGGNAVEIASTPSIDYFWRHFPHTTIGASEEAVGLPEGEPGNSEVGHLNIGSGRVVHEGLSLINQTIKSGEFEQNPLFKEAINHIKKNHSAMHLMGLASKGGIHSHIEHLYALLRLLKKLGLEKAYLHLFTDGRDSPPTEAISIITKIKQEIQKIGLGSIASVSGRFYAMDRDHRWSRAEKVYLALVKKRCPIAVSPEAGISSSYRQEVTDEFILPFIIETADRPFRSIKNNDAIIFFNFRSDRARELTSALTLDNFPYFDRGKKPENLFFITFVDYGEHFPVKVAFRAKNIEQTLAETISMAGMKQLHVAETEKYAHVTYFFNGGRENPFTKESRILISSPKVSTYDLKPEMSARQITKELLTKLNKNSFEFIVVNYANPDMVGHSGNLKAAIRACEVVSEEAGQVVDKVLKLKGTAIITADHGNAEQMIDPRSGKPFTEHTTSSVPFILINQEVREQKNLFRPDGKLADIASTILEIMGLKMPEEMEGRTLINQS